MAMPLCDVIYYMHRGTPGTAAQTDEEIRLNVQGRLAEDPSPVQAISRGGRFCVSALHAASSCALLGTLSLLLERLRDNSALQDSLLHGPLQMASQCGHQQVVQMLLRHAQDPVKMCVERSNTDGKTPWQIASDSGHAKLAHHLLTVGEPLVDVKWPEIFGSCTLENHLTLGLTAKGFMAVLQCFGFWKDGSVCNDAVNERMQHGLAWVNAICPGHVCGYDLQHAIARGIRPRFLAKVSMCEIMKASHHLAVGQANDFLCHTQAEPLEQTLLSMMLRELEAGCTRYFFLDYATLRQPAPEYRLTAVAATIKGIGNMTVMLMPIEGPSVLRRVYCLFELASALRCNVPVHIVCPPRALAEYRESLRMDYPSAVDRFGYVDISCAEIRSGREMDKMEIVKSMLGFDDICRVNKLISDAIIADLLAQIIRTIEVHVEGSAGPAIPGFTGPTVRLIADFLPQISSEKARHVVTQRGSFDFGVLHLAAMDGTPEQIHGFLATAGVDAAELLLKRTSFASGASQTPAQMAEDFCRFDKGDGGDLRRWRANMHVLKEAEEAFDVVPSLASSPLPEQLLMSLATTVCTQSPDAYRTPPVRSRFVASSPSTSWLPRPQSMSMSSLGQSACQHHGQPHAILLNRPVVPILTRTMSPLPSRFVPIGCRAAAHSPCAVRSITPTPPVSQVLTASESNCTGYSRARSFSPLPMPQISLPPQPCLRNRPWWPQVAPSVSLPTAWVDPRRGGGPVYG